MAAARRKVRRASRRVMRSPIVTSVVESRDRRLTWDPGRALSGLGVRLRQPVPVSRLTRPEFRPNLETDRYVRIGLGWKELGETCPSRLGRSQMQRWRRPKRTRGRIGRDGTWGVPFGEPV